MFIINGITYRKINSRTFSISLFFIFLKNLTHPSHSNYLSPFLKEIVPGDSMIPLLLGYLDSDDRISLEKLIGKGSDSPPL